MTHHALRPLRRLLLGSLAAAVLAGLMSCSSSSDPSSGTIDTTWRLQVLNGTGLRGVNVDMTHSSGFTVQSVTPIGPFASATCQSNLTAGRLRLACAASADTDAPFHGWELVLRHESNVIPTSEIITFGCIGSHLDGSTIALSCDLD